MFYRDSSAQDNASLCSVASYTFDTNQVSHMLFPANLFEQHAFKIYDE